MQSGHSPLQMDFMRLPQTQEFPEYEHGSCLKIMLATVELPTIQSGG